MSLAPYVHAMGRGPSKGRNLDREEAEDAFGSILDGKAAPEAIGALFMLMRYRGETASEIAGFITAMRARLGPWAGVSADVDWPSYAAGRSRGLPLFLLSAKLLAHAGYRVLLHGWNSHQNPVANVRAALPLVGIDTAETPGAAMAALDDDGIVYVPLESMSPRLLSLLKLRDVLGLRSPVNTALRGLNPGRARMSLQGVFHPTYRDLQRDAAALLEQRDLLVLKGAGGEFERNPGKAIALHGLIDKRRLDSQAAPLLGTTRRMNGGETDQALLSALWQGDADDEFAVSVVLGTADLALKHLGAPCDAQDLWARRHDRTARHCA